ncbi:AGAP002090-PA-like protein [Anopheles sinensis]|uniref:AGAP002090-PA-like protein n=1 Tax=Anopheles sinensis TaxID=74873 RepID=A0A084WSH7_ANOSI|nr:AGAP002090-PA-like protein [Anopheles sinensis]
MKAFGRLTDGRQHERQLTAVFLLLALWLTGGRMSPSASASAPALAGSAALTNITYSNSVVKTKYGPLRGIVFRASPVVVEGFLGVPYASPPIGSFKVSTPRSPPAGAGIQQTDGTLPRAASIP